jgi:hypothetical protein
LGEGQAKEAIFATGIDDSMVGHARFGLDDLSNREKSKLVHLSSSKRAEVLIFAGRHPVLQLRAISAAYEVIE